MFYEIIHRCVLVVSSPLNWNKQGEKRDDSQKCEVETEFPSLVALVTFSKSCLELSFESIIGLFFFALNMTALHCTTETEMYWLVLGECFYVWERKKQVMKLGASREWRGILIGLGLIRVSKALWRLLQLQAGLETAVLTCFFIL